MLAANNIDVLEAESERFLRRTHFFDAAEEDWEQGLECLFYDEIWDGFSAKKALHSQGFSTDIAIMKPDEFLDYYRHIHDNRILVSFKGPLSQAILVELGGFVKKQLTSNQDVKRIFSIFIEMTQNVLHHSAERDHSAKPSGVGVIMLMEKESHYLVSSGNLVTHERSEVLKKKCNDINSLSDGELKKAYRIKLKTETLEQDKGAGVGLYEISRKSDGALEYLSLPFDHSHQFFILTATVSKGAKP